MFLTSEGEGRLPRNRWTILAVLTIVRAAMAYQVQSVASVSPYLMADLGIDYAALGTLIGLYMLPGIVISLPGGMLGQRFGEARMCLIGLALMAVGGAIMGLAESYAAVIAGRLVSGVGAVILNVLLTKMVADWFAGREIITAMAILVNSWPLGFALGLVTQGALAEAAGWPVVMHLAAALCAASLLLTIVFYRPPPAAPAGPGAGGKAPAGSPSRLGLARRELVLVLLAGAMWSLYNVGFIVIVSFAPDFLIGLGLSPSAAGARASIFVWMTLATVPLGGFLAERSGRPDAMLALALVLFAGAAGGLLAWDGAAVLFVALGVVGGVPAGIIMALPARAVRAGVLAPAMGLYFTCYYVGMTALPAAAGWSRDLSGWSGAPLLFAAAMMLLTLAALAAFRWAEART